MYTAYILLGGNQGDVALVFRKAVVMISEAGLNVSERGSLFKSDAWGEGVQGAFYNQLLILRVGLEPMELLAALLGIEHKLGRERKPGVVSDRTIDMDILLIDDLIVSLPGLTIPHPRMHQRRFALVPLCEMVPFLIHPVLGKTMWQLLEDTTDQLRVEKAEKDKHTDISPKE